MDVLAWKLIHRDMDEEIWENIEPEEFTVQVIDPEYEFDAPRYFDFARPESDSEAREAERWFDTAGTCPPSRKLSFSFFFFQTTTIMLRILFIIFIFIFIFEEIALNILFEIKLI